MYGIRKPMTASKGVFCSVMISAPNALLESWSVPVYEHRWRAEMKASTIFDMTRCTFGNRPEFNTCPVPIDFDPVFHRTKTPECSTLWRSLQRVRTPYANRKRVRFLQDDFKISKMPAVFYWQCMKGRGEIRQKKMVGKHRNGDLAC